MFVSFSVVVVVNTCVSKQPHVSAWSVLTNEFSGFVIKLKILPKSTPWSTEQTILHSYRNSAVTGTFCEVEFVNK